VIPFFLPAYSPGILSIFYYFFFFYYYYYYFNTLLFYFQPEKLNNRFEPHRAVFFLVETKVQDL